MEYYIVLERHYEYDDESYYHYGDNGCPIKICHSRLEAEDELKIQTIKHIKLMIQYDCLEEYLNYDSDSERLAEFRLNTEAGIERFADHLIQGSDLMSCPYFIVKVEQ